MKIYVTKNAQRLGPFTPAEIQSQIAAGTLLPTDMAWHEGLSGWVAIQQIPGCVPSATPYPYATSTPPPPPLQRPVLVWIISIFFFILTPCLLLYLLFTFLRLCYYAFNAGEVGFHLLWPTGVLFFGFTALIRLLNLAAALCLFFLRRAAFYLFLISLTLSLLNFFRLIIFYHWPWTPHATDATAITTMVTTSLSYLSYIAIVCYVGHLFFTKKLR